MKQPYKFTIIWIEVLDYYWFQKGKPILRPDFSKDYHNHLYFKTKSKAIRKINGIFKEFADVKEIELVCWYKNGNPKKETYIRNNK